MRRLAKIQGEATIRQITKCASNYSYFRNMFGFGNVKTKRGSLALVNFGKCQRDGGRDTRFRFLFARLSMRGY